MTDHSTRHRGALPLRAVYRLVLALILLIPSLASAAIDRVAVEQLQLDIWRIRADFHMYTVMGGDSAYHDQLESSMQQGRTTFQALAREAESEQEEALLNNLTPSWEEFLKAANRNTVAELGYTDTYAAQDVNRLAAVMSSRLDNFGAAEAEHADLWQMAAYMQRMASEYLALAADPAGGMAVDTGEGRLEFRDAVPAFDTLLQDTRRKYRDDEAVNRALEQVASKWSFIRESLVKFYEDSVPFLVHRYTEQIINTLDQATSMPAPAQAAG
ncbi:hypothetical protein S7S_09480 [Isoalcanivorax pacificus W11-5]|uniref:Uncharacterized protein n=1 Tax=Isoalcanivorax pacificus W11-5 TaxID=391936 RepID=A0A0B4XPA6_9GAMM|nr:hypothetical protein [Isoalcanivorax pacificus]AJD48308.1 hypothetical protein S7S_09480 [Isoalcanivorax pacificus W11-5]